MPPFKAKTLPASLWREHRLYVPDSLDGLYRGQLSFLGLLETAEGGTAEHDIFGGPSIQDTHRHFAHRFPNSVVRMEDILLDPGSVFGALPYDLLQTLASHRVAVLDLPCGAGAGGLTFLGLLAELRRSHLIPQLPLSLKILGGDLSAHALDIYAQMFNTYLACVQPAAINAELRTQQWDATSVPSTNQLCDDWFAFAGEEINEYLVLVANFSGAGTSLISQIRPSLDHIMARLSNKKSTLLWIEPGGQRGRSFLAKIAKFLSSFTWLGRDNAAEAPVSHDFRWWHSLSGRELPGSVAVHRYRRRT